MKIMVIDDEEDVQLLFRQQFRQEIRKGQIQFHFSLSAEEAIEYLQNHRSDCLVLILKEKILSI